jgi:hypothetical protein
MRAAPHKGRQVRIGRAHGPAIPDCPDCPSAAARARRSGRSADRRDGLRHRRHRAYERIIRGGGAAGDRGDDAFLGNNIDDDNIDNDNIDDDNDIGDERRDIGDDNIGDDNDGGDERRDIDLVVGHIGEIHWGGDRRRIGSSGAVIRSSLQYRTALGDVPAIGRVRGRTVPGRYRSFLRALIEARNHPRGPGAVGVVGLAELRAQQPLFGVDAGKERRDQQRGQQHPDSGTKS